LKRGKERKLGGEKSKEEVRDEISWNVFLSIDKPFSPSSISSTFISS
jgi:hypothetical protein